jgi:hypothetical protein
MQHVSGGLSSVASIGGAGLGPYDTHRIYAHYISHNKHLGRSPPPLKQFHRGSKSRRACGELTRTRCPNAQCTLARRHTILRSRCQSYCDAARRLSLVVTPREGSHARFEPLEHRAHVRGAPLHAAPNTPCPPPLMRAPSLSLSLSLACSAHPQALGTAFLWERNSARIARDGAQCSPSAGT